MRKCGGQYLDVREAKEEGTENCITGSFIIFVGHSSPDIFVVSRKRVSGTMS
jgi:hypothetical protein